MTVVRSLAFNLAFLAWSTLIHILCLPLLAGPRTWIVAAGRLWTAVTLGLLRLLCGLDYRVRGLEHLPAGACIIACKHQSAWETMAMPLVIADPSYVLKRELLRVPLFGWYLARAGMVAIDRSGGARSLKAMVAQARPIAAAGRRIVIFPEGTRTAPGSRRPYQPGVAGIARQLALPTVPAAVNSGLFWGRRSFLKRPGTITLEFLPPLPPDPDRRRFLATLEQRIEEATARLLAEAAATPGANELRTSA